MTRLSRDSGDRIPSNAVLSVATDINIISKRFPNYSLGDSEQMEGAKDSPEVLSMKDIVAKETTLLIEQQKRLSVRDLARKFEKGLAAAAKLSDEVCFNYAVLYVGSLDYYLIYHLSLII